MISRKHIAISFLIAVSGYVNAQGQKSQMKFLGAFDAGQEGVNIYKLYDSSDNVICYLLMPETVGRKPADESGKKWIYDGNTIGSISCVRTKTDITVGGPIVNDILQGSQKTNKK